MSSRPTRVRTVLALALAVPLGLGALAAAGAPFGGVPFGGVPFGGVPSGGVPFGGAPSGSPGAPAARPHVVLVSLDTLRADRLGCYGYDRPTSPFIDELADAGVLFEDASAPSSKTAPSHMSMFTGVHPGVHGVRNFYGREAWAPNADLATLPELVSRGGWVTAGFTGGGMLSEELGFGRGFDVYDGRGGGADRVFDRAAAWVREAAADLQDDEPVFLFVHTYEIHDPYTPPAEWQARFCDPAYDGRIDSTRVEYPENAAEVWKTDPSFYEGVQQRFWGGFDGRRAGDFEHLSDLYDACIAYTDHLLRGLFDELRAAGWLENAVVIVTSDHGEELGERGGVSHQTIYDEILHVPLIVVPPATWTDARRDVRSDAPVMGVDLAPSVVDLLGLGELAGSQGRSWATDLRGAGAPDGRERLFRPVWAELATPQNEWLALRRGPYKLFVHRADEAQRRLYDRWFDPGEQVDRAGDLTWITARLEQEARGLRLLNAAGRERFPAGEAAMGDAALGALYALGYAEHGPTSDAPGDGDDTDVQAGDGNGNDDGGPR